MSRNNFDWSQGYLHPSPWKMEFPPLALHQMFFDSAEREGAKPMLDFLGRKVSYAEMADAVRRVAKGLQDKGIGKGDQIGLFLPNVPHYIAAYYGALAAGATVVNFSPLYTVDELAHQVADSGTEHIVHSVGYGFAPHRAQSARSIEPFRALSLAASPRRYPS